MALGYASGLAWKAVVTVAGLVPEDLKDESFIKQLEDNIRNGIEAGLGRDNIPTSDVAYDFGSDATITQPGKVPVIVRIELLTYPPSNWSARFNRDRSIAETVRQLIAAGRLRKRKDVLVIVS